MVRVSIVETGISLMELDYNSLVISMSLVQLRQLPFVVLLLDQLVYIAVILQLLLSMMILTNLWEKQSMWDCIQLMEVNSDTD